MLVKEGWGYSGFGGKWGGVNGAREVVEMGEI